MADELSSPAKPESEGWQERTTQSVRPAWRCQAVFPPLGLLLLAAAALKAYQIYSEPAAAGELAGTVALIGFETTFGIWLLAGVRDRWTWRAAVACFSLFAAVSAYKISIGETFCGCFGSLRVSPTISLGVDVACLALLMFCRKDLHEVSLSSLRPLGARLATVALAALLAATGLSIVGQSRFVRDDGNGTFAGDLVILEPQSWVGARWPLLGASGLESNLAAGEWEVLLFRADCHVCHDVMVELEQELLQQGGQPRVALIGIDRKQDDPQVARLHELACLLGYLPQDREWFATTPIRLRLRDGMCVSAGVIERWN